MRGLMLGMAPVSVRDVVLVAVLVVVGVVLYAVTAGARRWHGARVNKYREDPHQAPPARPGRG